MNTHWKLRSILDEHHITPNALASKIGEKNLSRNAVYKLADAKAPPTRLQLETFDVLIPALRVLTGKPIEVSDLLEYRAPTVSASGLPYTGDPETDEILDDPELTRRLLLRAEAYAGLSPEETKAKIAEELRTGKLVPIEKVFSNLGITPEPEEEVAGN